MHANNILVVCKFIKREILQCIPSLSMILTQVSAFWPILSLEFETLVIRTENDSLPSLASESSMIGTLPHTDWPFADGINVRNRVLVS